MFMVDGNGAHPSPDRLVAFAQGRLNEDELVAMSRHLQRCPSCLSAAESMPGDFFAATLRQYSPRAPQPAPAALSGAPAPVGTKPTSPPVAAAPALPKPAPAPPPAPPPLARPVREEAKTPTPPRPGPS